MMTEKENGRIELLNKIKDDHNIISVSNITELFCGLISMYFKETHTGAAVKKKLSEVEFICFITGFTNTFLSSLYVSASKDMHEYKERLRYVKEVNEDVEVNLKKEEVVDA